MQFIARALLLLGAALTLAACSVPRVAYNQGATVAYWWLDGYVDFTPEQSRQARGQLDQLLAWHRSNELPLYAERLTHWQTLTSQDITPEQACSEFEAVRASLTRVTERGLAPLATLALQLGPDQLEHMRRHQIKQDEDFADDFLKGTPAKRLERRVERTVDRYETFYGTLTEAQRKQLQTGLEASPWDPQRTQAERQRRQASLLELIRNLQATYGQAGANAATTPAEAVAALRNWSQRLLQSPTPGYAAYSASLVKAGCTQFASLHNSTSPEQRIHLLGVLKSYESDLRALAAQD